MLTKHMYEHCNKYQFPSEARLIKIKASNKRARGASRKLVPLLKFTGCYVFASELMFG